MTVKVVAPHHIGITVSNLERSVKFYSEIFGLDPATYFENSGPELAKLLGIPGSISMRHTHIPVGDFVLELMEIHPSRRSMDQRHDDIGHAYICFRVADLEAVRAELIDKGFEFNSEIMHSNAGVSAGTKSCIMKDPDGKNLEFIELPSDSGLLPTSLHARAATEIELKKHALESG